MMAGRLTDEQWAEVIARKRAGESVPSLCASFGLKKSRIYRELKAAGVTENHGSEKGRPAAPAGEAIRLTDVEIRDLMERVRRSLWRYRDHPEFDDILGEAYLQMWQALRSVRQADLRSTSRHGRRGLPSGLACRAAWNGASIWMGSSRSQYRRWNHEGKELPWIDSLDQVMEQARESPELSRLIPVVPDFAPALIERLYALDLWRRGVGELLDVEMEIVGRTVLEGEDPATVGAEFGLSQSRVYQIRQRALNRFRRQIGLPLRNDGTPEYQRTVRDGGR